MRNVTDLNFPLTLAPMVGLSHVALRRLIHDYLPKQATTHWPTEMLNSRRIPGENLKFTPETLRDEFESHLVPQILGNEEKPIAESVRRLVNEWGASGIDINMGCPVQKALKHNYGVSLMGDVQYAARVVEVTKKNSTVPVSVKLRAVGSSHSVPELILFVNTLVEAGADWITLHPRTAEQKRRGHADWTQITELKKNCKVPIIGNGDIQVVGDVLDMMDKTGCDKVMAGRALAARPWMMWQLGEKLGMESPEMFQNLHAPQSPEAEGAEYGRALLRFIDYCEYYFMQQAGSSENLTLRKVSFFVRTTHVWLEFGHALMSAVSVAKNLTELRENVRRFFESEQRMMQKTELRQ
ncbi:MAG: nitrogen fixation protein NifR [Bdellovibrionales bacterium RIFCSPHIGHO2_01_FULL_40_29]|nr:MAG: nitrogen fixation protein NifR [Bdellovibrionales bacterium RIFCSPHIGHO2_01_FULL_40_29]OFZ32374.1 MAG: nitrogen fixation protein NifR [Bdellovibrionales bacterium RIFCSPHIGHO2_02_FULL_40_15]